jgi:hypothetical protein
LFYSEKIPFFRIKQDFMHVLERYHPSKKWYDQR